MASAITRIGSWSHVFGTLVVAGSFVALSCIGCTTGGSPVGPLDAQASDGQTEEDGGGVFDKKDAKYTLSILLNSEGVTILDVVEYDPSNPGLESVPANTPDSLKWVITDDDGKEIAKGYVPDPRVVVSEGYREESAMFRLDVPTKDGTLHLYENNPTF